MPPACWTPRLNISSPPAPSRATARPIGPSPTRRSTSARAAPPATPAPTPSFNSRRNTRSSQFCVRQSAKNAPFGYAERSVAGHAEQVAAVVEQLVQEGGAGRQGGAVLHGEGVDGHQRE